MENRNEEMDLIDFCGWIWSKFVGFFKGIGNFFGGLLRLAYRQKAIMSVSLALGVAAGLFLSFPKTYKGEFLVYSPFMESHYLKSIVDGLETKAHFANQTIGEAMNLPADVAADVRKVKSYFVFEDKETKAVSGICYKKKVVVPDTNTVVSPTKLAIRVIVRNPQEFDARCADIIRFLSENEAVRTNAGINREIMMNKMAFLESEIAVRDSLARKGVNLDKQDGIRLFTEKQSRPSSPVDDMQKMNGKKLDISRTIQMAGDQNILFLSSEMKKFPSNFWPKQLIVFLTLFGAMGLSLACFWENRKKIRKYIEGK